MTSREAGGLSGRAGPPSGLPSGGSGRPLPGFGRLEKEGTRREVGSSERRGLPGPEDTALFFELPGALLGGSGAASKRTLLLPTLRAGSEQLLPAGRRAFAEARTAETREAPAEVGWAGPGPEDAARAQVPRSLPGSGAFRGRAPLR